jgi:hypothetical protein
MSVVTQSIAFREKVEELSERCGAIVEGRIVEKSLESV